MSSIDKRIVQMEFDNDDFESGVSESLSTLEKLHKTLSEKFKMKNATDGLEEIDDSIKNLSTAGLDELGSDVENVTSKFSALKVMGVTALMNITNSAMDAGKKLVSALTVDPIKTGFSEYETKMNAIQTILTNTANKGTTLEDVTKALDELNTYADETIYNFAEMTKNIGTFTAAGVDLETAVAAIKGIANLGAGSGSTPAQVNTAMYQLSQALSQGYVGLQDWNSMENAGMASETFRNALMDTAEAMGINVDRTETFRKTLQDGWLTSEVLLETLNKFSENELFVKAATEVKTVTGLIDTMKESVQSGWAKSWEHIIGDKDQATKLLTGIKDGFEAIIEPSATARNNMLKFWNETGGRDDVIEGLTNIAESLGKGFSAIGDAWKDVFPPMTGQKLVEISKGFKDLTEKFKMSDSTANKIKSTFKGLFSVLKLGKDAISTVVKAFAPVAGAFGGITDVLLSVTSGVGSFISQIGAAADSSNIFGKISDGINSAFESVGNVFTNIANAIEALFSYISKLDFSGLFGSLGDGIGQFANGLKPIIDGIGKMIGTIDLGAITNLIEAAFAGALFKNLKSTLDDVGDIVGDIKGVFGNMKGAANSIKDTLDTVRESLETYQNSINAGILLKIAAAIALLAGSLVLLAAIDGDKLEGALSGITILFIELVGAVAVLLKLASGVKFKGFLSINTTFLALSTSILILAAAMKVISGLDWDQIARGLIGIAGAMVVMVAATKLIGGKTKGMMKASAGLIIFSLALRSMAGVVERFGKMKPETILTGLIAIAALMSELALFMKAMDFNKMGLTKSVGLLVLAGALNVFADAVKSFGVMDTNDLIQGLVAIGAVLTELGVFMALSKGALGIIPTAIGLTILSASMHILAGALKSFGQMKWEEIGRGLTAMAGALTVIGVAVALIPKTMLLATAIGLTAMSGALLALSLALNALGQQTWDEIARSLVSLAGALAILALAMVAMSGGLAGAAAMVIMAGALALFVPQLIALSQLSLAQVGIGLLALAGAFTILGVAGLALTPVIPSLISLAGAVALLSLSCLGVGVGLLALGTGLTLVAGSGAAAGFALAEILRQLINLLPQFGTKLGEAFGTFAEAIGTQMPKIVQAIGQLIVGILTALRDNIPQIVTVAVELVVAFAEAIGTAIPTLVEVGVNMIINIVEGVASNIGRLVDAGCDAIVNFINGVSANLGQIIDAGINLAVNFINGVANGISSNQGAITGAISNLISSMISIGVGILTSAIGSFVSAGFQLIQGVATGIGNAIGTVVSVASSIPGRIASAINSGVSTMFSVGSNIIRGLVSGIKSAASSAVSAAKGVVDSAIQGAKNLLGINSPSKVFMEIGKFTVQGFTKGLDKYSRLVDKPTEGLVNSVIDTMSKPMSAIAQLLNDDVDLSPVISPVVDLTDVKKGSKAIGNLMATSDSVKLAGETSGVITASIGQIQNGNDNSDIISALKDLKKEISNTNSVTYAIDGVTYDDGSNISNAVQTLVRAAKIEGRV